MSKKRVLFVTQEMEPYTAISEITKIVSKLPQYIQEKGMEIRVLMPRYGNINERRHRLHEVVRLSGMNIIVDDDDFPLIIKVASLPGARMQVYFLDNEEFFKRKALFEDEDGNLFDDNQDRMVFFCKGVMETVKKFGWAPDIIHCHGWLTGLIPLYLKTVYRDEPIFQNAKILYSVYNNNIENSFDNKFIEKAKINYLSDEDLTAYSENGVIKIHKGAFHFADGVLVGSEELSEDIKSQVDQLDIPSLDYKNEEEYLSAYAEFFNSFVDEE
jgi:starch synthase